MYVFSCGKGRFAHTLVMEIELDFVFETLLLLTKKKYAARVVKDRRQQLDGTYSYRTEREVKGMEALNRTTT